MKIVTPVNNKNVEVYSFDIFDTLLARRVATPLGIFAIMQEKLRCDERYFSIPELLRNNFALLRHKTEFWVRDNMLRNCAGIQDISIEEIYSCLKTNQGLTNEQVKSLIDLEVETEKNNLVLIEENMQLLKKYYFEGKKVILISDMYFSRDNLKKILQSIDSIFKNIDIYVSGDIKRTKSSGDMYRYISRKCNYKYENWTHYDDSIHNIERANELGIEGVFYQRRNSNYLADYVFSDFFKNFDNALQAYLGCSGLAKLNNNPQKSLLFDFGADIAGPILFSYVDFILNQSLARGIDTLYFIARDGYLPMLIAQKIVNKKRLNIKIKYIYGSRKAWRIPNKDSIISFVNIVFSEHLTDITPRSISQNLGLDLKDFSSVNKFKLDKKLSYQELQIIKANLTNNSFVLKKILDNFSQKRELLVSYLKQEINFDEKFAFVELNGSGRTQDWLADIIKTEIKDVDFKTFYYHLNQDANIKKLSDKVCYIPFENCPPYYIEIFSTSFDYSTVGYENVEGRIIPIKEKTVTYKDEFKECRDGILSFVDSIFEYLDKNELFISNIIINYFYEAYLSESLDPLYANILGSFPFEIKKSSTSSKGCALAFTWWDVFRFAWNGKEKSYALNFISYIRSSQRKRKVIDTIVRKGFIKDKLNRLIYKLFWFGNNYSKTGRKKVFKLFNFKLSFDMIRPSFYTDVKYLCTFIKFLLQKRKKEKITNIEKIRFITYREPLYNGGGGGQGAAMTMNKMILPEKFKNLPIEYTFEVPNKYLPEKNVGPNVEFSGIRFAIDETKYDKNVIYVTHEEATAFGLWLMGKNYIMFSHLQGARAEESKNFGYKFSKLSENIIKFCEATAMKNAYSVSFVSEGAYKYFCNSEYRGLEKNEFKKGPIIYNTLYAKNELEQYLDLKYDPEYLTILTSGSLTIAKGVDRTLDLVETICSKTNRKIRHIFIGEGVLQNLVETRLNEIATKYPNFSYVTVSRCSDGNMPYLQSICDVFIVLHRIAIFDLSTLEIMDKSKAIVLSDVGGNPEFNVEDNIIMWSEEKENYDEVAEKVLSSDLRELGQRNKSVYDRYFGHEPYRKAYENLLSDFTSSVLK